MLQAIVSWVAVAVVAATATGILLTRDWRWSLGLLSAQYLGDCGARCTALASRDGGGQAGGRLDGDGGPRDDSDGT